MTFYMQDPHLSDHRVRCIVRHASKLRGHFKRVNPIARGVFGGERRKDRVWVDFRSKKRGPHRAPRITFVVCQQEGQ